jgi:hypothetical protein
MGTLEFSSTLALSEQLNLVKNAAKSWQNASKSWQRLPVATKGWQSSCGDITHVPMNNAAAVVQPGSIHS